MNMDLNARRDILPASVGGSLLRRLAWRRSRKSDGGDCNRDGHIRSPSPPLHAARLCFIRRGSSRYRRVRCCVDIDPRVGRSEAHTSELQSLMRISYAVFFLNKKTKNEHDYTPHLYLSTASESHQ